MSICGIVLVAMTKKNLKKTINSLLKLNKIQQNMLYEEISKIKVEKEAKLGEIEILEDKIRQNSTRLTSEKTNFYQKIKRNIFSYKDIDILKIDLGKIVTENSDFLSKKNQIENEIKDISEKLTQKSEELKKVIIKEEKFRYLLLQNI